jgi:tetratricopeptide (TPR) repeat protein
VRRARESLSAGLLLALVATLSLSCAAAPGAGEALADLDSLVGRGAAGKALDAAFARAMKAARSADDWIGILGQARRADGEGRAQATAAPARAPSIAQRAIKAFPGSERLALAAAVAWLEAGQPERGLALFPAVLDPEAQPALWAGAMLAARRAGSLPPEDWNPEAALRLARASGEQRFLLDAAVLSLAAGQRMAAQARLEAALAAGVAVPETLLWDAGLYQALLDRHRATGKAPAGEASKSAASLALAGDAASTLGRRDLARAYWEASIEASPGYSWKTWAKLGRLAEEVARAAAAIPPASSHPPEWAVPPEEGPSPSRAGDPWYARMERLFPGDPAVILESARRLAAASRDEEARQVLSELASRQGLDPATAAGAAALELALRGSQESDRVQVAAALELAAARPDSPLALESALRRLLERGSYGEFLRVHAAMLQRGVLPGRDWFYACAADILVGKLDAARKGLESATPAGMEAPFALGLLMGMAGDQARALELFSLARERSADPRLRARALVEEGKAWAALGNQVKAGWAFGAARAADPGNAEAFRLGAGSP